MNKFSQVTDIDSGEAYAFIVIKSDGVTAIAASPNSSEWVEWANQTCKSFDDIQESLSYDLQCELPIILNERTAESVKSLLSDEQFESVSELVGFSSVELVDAVGGHGRRYAVKSLNDFEPIESPTVLPLRSFAHNSRQTAINYKALTFRADSTFSEVAFEMKRARALWDPDLGPSGGWRCPPGSQYGGYITDRFGRGCGGGALRRVGRALINAGRGIDKLGARRDVRRLNRAAERAQRGETRRERVGAAARRGVADASNALERGAQRLVGEYQPRDYDPRTGRMRRRGVNPPEVSRERRNAINSRLVEIRDELDDLADKPRNPANARRENELMEENRRLRRERDGTSPQRVARVRQAPALRRVIAPAAGQRQPRQQGARPVRKPVAERGRENRRERLARRLVGDFRPDEYKPGDKKRIKNRKNRYADVSDAQLRRALANRSPKRARPGEARDAEVRRRQDRLEILQEMLNRGMEIPEQYKREVRQYRLKPQRQRRGAGMNRVGRAAVGLERAAQRVEGERRPRTARNRREQGVAPARPNAVEMQKRRIERARKNRPDGVSDNDWRDYEEYLDNIPDGNLIPEDGAPQLEPVRSYDSWKKRVKPNLERDATPRSNRRRGQLDDLTDEEITERLVKYRQGGKEPFDMASLSDDEVARLQGIVDRGYVNGPFRDRRRNGRMSMHPAARLVGGEYNMRLDDGRFESNRPTPRPLTDIPSNRLTLTRERRRQAVSERGAASSLRRPMPKRFQGDAFDMDALDRDQKIRMRNLLKDEKAKLDAEWRKRLGLRSGEEITDKAIKDYIKERENNKPGAYIGTLKAKANDWKVLSEWQKKVDDRPAGANLIGENDALNRIGPKRRGDVIKNFNDGVPAISRSGRPSGEQKPKTPRIISRNPEAVVNAERVSSSIAETINESIGGSMPDDRSRRNVRNRFPNNGLPENAFWREAGWVGRDENDRANHERRFGRYYDSNGKLNARGRLVNRQLNDEKRQVESAKEQISREARSASRSGKRTARSNVDSNPPVSGARLTEVIRAIPETDAFKEVDARLKADESAIRARYRNVSDPSELADAIRRYQADATSADDTLVFMANNGKLNGVEAEIYAINLAHFQHAERMREFLQERLEAVDSERAKRLMRELNGQISSIQTPRPKTPSVAPRDNMDVALAKIKARRFGAGQFADIKKRTLYKENLRRWREELDEDFEDLKVLVDRGLPMNAQMAMAEQFARVDDFDLLPDDEVRWTNLSEAEARIEHIEKIRALLDGNSIPKRRTTGSSRRTTTPPPNFPEGPASASALGAQGANSPANAGKHLVVGTPRERVKALPDFGNDGTPDAPMPNGKPIVNPQIKSADDAIQWLNDGKSLNEVPQEYWFDALDAHANIPGGQKQFIEVAKNGGVIGETRIFVALGPDGKPSGQGLVLKDDPRDPYGQSNINEVIGVNLLHALGMQMDPATFDGEGSRGVPISVIPFAWNRAPEGDIITPEVEGLRYVYDSNVIPNFDARQFEDLEDKAFPIRLQAVLGNYILGVPDRHLQNHMGAMVDGKAMVVPIDLGWAGQSYYDDFSDYVDDFDAELIEGDFGIQKNLLRQIKDHINSLDANQRAVQASALTDVIDQTIERLETIKSAGSDDFVEKLFSSVDRATIDPDTLDGMIQSAEKQYSHIMRKLSELKNQRDDIVRRWS